MQFNIKKIYCLLFAVILFSCRKGLLDQAPNDRLNTSVFWKTDNDALLGANAVYTYLPSQEIFFWDGITDIAHSNVSFRPEALVESGAYDAANSRITEEWQNNYAGIGTANKFFENVDHIVTANAGLMARLKAEVRTLRAYHYLRLAALYGGVPIVTQSLSAQQSKQLKRASADETWNFIFTELTAAAADLPASYTATADKGRVTKGAAWGLLARAYLYAGKYTEAAATAKQVMGLNYALYPQYEKLFSYAAENNSEVILDKQFIAGTYANNVFKSLAPYSLKSSDNLYVPTKSFVDLFDMANGKSITDPASGFNPEQPYAGRDPRLKFSVIVSGDALPGGTTFKPEPGSGTPDALGNTYLASTTGFAIKKYVNNEDFANPANCGINIILLRYAEILLTYAEAKIELNQADQSVTDAINQVRNGRADVKMPSVASGLDQQTLRAIVRKERILELGFEGTHLFDIRRWKTAEQVMPGNVYGMTYKEGNTLKTAQVQAFARVFIPQRHYLWPIPQRERDLNPGLDKNPGW